RIDIDDPCPVLARLPEVARRDGSALGDVGPADPNDLGQGNVAHRVAGPIDSERLLVAGRGRDHAQPAVVIDVPRLQTDAGELADQVTLLGGHAGPAEDREGVVAVRRLDSADPGGDALDRLLVADGPEALRRRWIAELGAGEPVVVGALEVATHAFGAEH